MQIIKDFYRLGILTLRSLYISHFESFSLHDLGMCVSGVGMITRTREAVNQPQPQPLSSDST